MFRKLIGFYGFFIILGLTVGASLVWGRTDREVIKREIPLTTEERLDVHLSFGVGELEILKGRGDRLVRATLEFPEDEEAPEFQYRKHGRGGDLRIETGDRFGWDEDEKGVNIEIEDGDWDWGSAWGDDKRNEWNIALTDKIPISLDIETGASNNEIDLTGLKIADLDIEAGACELALTVDEPSGYRTRVISIEGGAARLRAEGLGNLNFDRMEFDGGAGQFTLDFSGDLDHRATVEIDLGVGQLNVFVPEELGIKVDCSGCTFASVSASGNFEEEDDVYVNDRYGLSKGEILLEISASLATVNVETIR